MQELTTKKVLKTIRLLILHFLVSALCQSKLNISRETVYVRVTWPFLKVYLTWRRMLFKRKRMLCNKPNFGISALQPALDSAGTLPLK